MKYTDKQLYQVVSSNIKFYRTINKLTQRGLADKANISYSYLSKIESDGCDQSFSLATLNQIANALNVDITEFFKENYKSMKQVDIIVLALRNLGGQAKYPEIYKEYERIIKEPLTAGKKAGIRKTVEDHSSDSDNFKGKDDLFFSVYGKGQGVWGLRNN